MFRFSWFALVAAIVCLSATMIQGVPIGDDKADELKMVSSIDIESELKPTTENPKDEEPPSEPVQANDNPSDHIQIIKMDVSPKDVEQIEELEKEIVKEFHLDEKSDVVQLLPCIHEHMKTDSEDTTTDEKKTELTVEPLEEKTETEAAPVVPPVEETVMEAIAADSLGQRTGRAMETSTPKESLTDEDITEIVKMISFPQNDEETQSQNSQQKDTEIEPRTTVEDSSESKTRVGRAIRNEGRGYYILAFAPVEGPVVPAYTKLDIIPIERSANGNFEDDYEEDDQQRLQKATDDTEEGRLISSKQLGRYIRLMMRQIRKGTRKVDRKTRFKSADDAEPTVENFLRKAYNSRKEQQAKEPKKSWFSWNQN